MTKELNAEIKSMAEFYAKEEKADDFVDFFNNWSDTNYSEITDNQERLILFGFAKNLVTISKDKVQDTLQHC